MPWTKPLSIVGLAMTLVLTGCGAMQLRNFTRHAAEGDDAWIARQNIHCEAATATCSQLYLAKGEACLRLANAGHTPAGHYACAVDALSRGIALKQSWPNGSVQRQYQERLCRSLDKLYELQSGEAAEATLARFADAAAALYQAAPASVPAVYYLAMVRLRRAEGLLSGLNAADQVPVCNRLKRTLTGVLTVMQAATQNPGPDWPLFAKDYQRLAYDLGTAIRVAQCH